MKSNYRESENVTVRKSMMLSLSLFVMFSTLNAMIRDTEAMTYENTSHFLFLEDEPEETEIPEIVESFEKTTEEKIYVDQGLFSGTDKTEEDIIDIKKAEKKDNPDTANQTETLDFDEKQTEKNVRTGNILFSEAESENNEKLQETDEGQYTEEPEEKDETPVTADVLNTQEMEEKAGAENTDDPEKKYENTEEVSCPAVTFTSRSVYDDQPDVIVTAEVPEGALPEGTEMRVTAIKADQNLIDQVENQSEGNVKYIQALDIAFIYRNEEIEPLLPVRITMKSELIKEAEEDSGVDTELYHLKEETGTEKIDYTPADSQETAEDEIAFESGSFSVYVFVGVEVITERYITAEGEAYIITAVYETDSGIPEDAVLAVREIIPGTDEYDHYVTKSENTLGWQDGTAGYARFFDISIADKDDHSIHYQPAEGSTVSVTVELEDNSSDAMNVIHFGEDPEILDNDTSEGAVSFEASGFSVYAIIDAPEPVPGGGWTRVSSVEEIASGISEFFYLKNPQGFYFTNEMYNVNNTSRTGIRKTKPASSEPGEAAAKYYFEQVSDNRFRVYCYGSGGQKQYVRQSSNSLLFVTEENAMVFTIDAFPGDENSFRVLGENGYYWNMQGGTPGNGFAAWNNATDTNARIQLEYLVEQEDDPYELDGKTFGIAYHNDSAVSAALTAESITVGNRQRLAGLDMIMKPDVLDNDGVLLCANDSDIQEWTFEKVEGDRYYISTTVSSEKKYLTFDGNQIYLSDTPDPVNSLIRAVPGTGANAGKWHFTVNNYSLNYAGNGFNAASGDNSSTWMNLVEKSVLTEDDFKLYNAKKVSVSDEENVYNHQQVIIYTRIWNDSAKKYEFYAVDHDGTLIRCYDTGDGIEWVGTQVNTALWEFTEYTDSEGAANYYYELQNVQYGNFIAPQLSKNQVMSDEPVGINLNGRRYDKTSTPIIAWDDSQYSYSGLKTENGRAVPCALAESEDFFFAVVNPVDPDDRLSEVGTINGTEYGITMKMIDFNDPEPGRNPDSPRSIAMNGFFGGDNNNPGLLSSTLGADGYPVSTSVTGSEGHSLSELFNNMGDVNHLFIESIYQESGYFEYSSTSNFAHLNENGNFTVYDQLGAIGDYHPVTGTHGQFLPYNDLTEGRYCTFVNQTNVLGQELSDMDARKGEKLYNLGNRRDIDYQFGMEMSAGFTQTADGLDAWGHDIIFEFSGDDDFWFYVDGVLVLDLGGVHSAMTGSINFRTGEVISSRGNTTLYEIFTDTLGQARADELFETKTVDGRTVHVFKDYSNHSMRMFYMERGAGASNLHMRFNLAALKPGTFVLSKKLSGVSAESNSLIEFPYQITWYDRFNIAHLLTEKTGEAYNVLHKDSARPVRYQESLTVGSKEYGSVFFLKPGESAVISLPQDAERYEVVECAVDTAVYDRVKANGELLEGTGTGRKDFAVSPASADERPKVEYDNHVSEGAMRTLRLTKRLYDSGGDTRLTSEQNPTPFAFRLYLGNEFTDAGNIPAANLYPYYVKNGNGEYCRWDAGLQKFVSLGITSYESLTVYLETLSSAEREAIVFRTSMNGSISKIPADHTVEVRDLIVGTHWKTEERDSEIPKGYTLRLEDGYTRVDGTEVKYGTEPVSDTMKAGDSPEVEVRNQKGWGLTAEKVWTDKDFMADHDSIYFAVYAENGSDPELVEGSVREMKTTETSLYWFFDNLQSGVPFDHYKVYEVELTGGTANDSGVVTGYTDIRRIEEKGILTIGGTPVGGTYQEGYTYTVGYERGEQTVHNENVRVDKVTNSRPGIRMYKTKWDNSALAGAVFTLKDRDGTDVAAESYTSALPDGLITIAYLNEGMYTLEEISTPKGFTGLDQPVTIEVRADGRIEVSGPEGMYEFNDAEEGRMAEIRIKNRTAALQVRKQDAGTKTALANAHFALYHQVSVWEDGHEVHRKDYTPIPGYEDLVTDEQGILREVNIENLTWGNTYYLTETQAPEEYELLKDDICFTVGKNGIVTLNTAGSFCALESSDDTETGVRTYTLSVLNGKMEKIRFKKVDIARPEDSALAGAKFDLYRVREGEQEQNPMLAGLLSGTDGFLAYQSETVFSLPVGVYHLIETEAPACYNMKTEPVVITVRPDNVTYDENTSLSASGRGVTKDTDQGVWTILVSNSAGVELPNTGGTGTAWYYLAGGIFVILSAISILKKKNQLEQAE